MAITMNEFVSKVTDDIIGMYKEVKYSDDFDGEDLPDLVDEFKYMARYAEDRHIPATIYNELKEYCIEGLKKRTEKHGNEDWNDEYDYYIPILNRQEGLLFTLAELIMCDGDICIDL